MAVDTLAKRFEIMSLGDGALLPAPDGTVEAQDRIHFLELYGGLFASAPVVAADYLILPGLHVFGFFVSDYPDFGDPD